VLEHSGARSGQVLLTEDGCSRMHDRPRATIPALPPCETCSKPCTSRTQLFPSHGNMLYMSPTGSNMSFTPCGIPDNHRRHHPHRPHDVIFQWIRCMIPFLGCVIPFQVCIDIDSIQSKRQKIIPMIVTSVLYAISSLLLPQQGSQFSFFVERAHNFLSLWKES
jgi:hypothetical protein